MARDIVFFIAPRDETAAGTRLRGPGRDFETVTCHFIEPDRAIAEWDMYAEEPSAELPPERLTRALASPAELEELAGRCPERARSRKGATCPNFQRWSQRGR